MIWTQPWFWLGIIGFVLIVYTISWRVLHPEMGFYEFLWRHIGGRMWTFIMRDIIYTSPIVMFTVGFLIGFFIRPIFQWRLVLSFLFGFLLAHLIWGAKWIPGEGTERITIAEAIRRRNIGYNKQSKLDKK